MIVGKSVIDHLNEKMILFKKRESLKRFFKDDLLETLYDKGNWEKAGRNLELFHNPERKLICRHCNTEIQDKRLFAYFHIWTPKNDFFIDLHSKCAFSEKVYTEYDQFDNFNYTFSIIDGFV